MKRFCVLIIFSLLGACIPATVPPQLHYTPGPPVVIAAQIYQGAGFTVEYPAGWLVISSAASDSPSVIFVAPDEAAVILVGVEMSDPPMLPGAEDTHVTRRILTLTDGRMVRVSLRARPTHWEIYTPFFAYVVESIR